jgi:methylated-DNA-[protein]-cysteine S-methyltransferase
MTYLKHRIATPTGDMTLVAHERALVALVWDETELGRLGLAAAAPGTNAPLAAGALQLDEYFRGKRARFDLPLEPAGTEFQRAVWSQLGRIPYGSTWSYRELAARVGNPGAVRAVGTANGRNPLCIFIPCHRVVRASGETGGYAGGVERKTYLLELERASPKGG